MLKKILKTALDKILKHYSIFKIYRLGDKKNLFVGIDGLHFEEVTAEELSKSSNTLIKDQAWYGGEQAAGYACKKGTEIVAICWYWYGARYQLRNFWPLKPKEAKLVQIITTPEMRSKGIAQQLIAFSSQQMMAREFSPLYARIWYNNYPSINSFERCGWRKIATVIEYQIKWANKASKIIFNKRPL